MQRSTMFRTGIIAEVQSIDTYSEVDSLQPIVEASWWISCETRPANQQPVSPIRFGPNPDFISD